MRGEKSQKDCPSTYYGYSRCWLICAAHTSTKADVGGRQVHISPSSSQFARRQLSHSGFSNNLYSVLHTT
jgi:hypothetical protein